MLASTEVSCACFISRFSAALTVFNSRCDLDIFKVLGVLVDSYF